ncbi:MAG: cyclic nucleotide-binding domain-containing protein [Chloroflexi bacterium]|nr:cyclic nucleotide-binding domain-containing protein [Chloroflexota bacterium]
MASSPGMRTQGTASRPEAAPPAIAWFESLPVVARDRLAPLVAQLDLDAGVTFMHEGDPAAFLAILISGRVALRMRIPDRGAITILTLEANDIVGWSVIVPPYRATTNATTLEPTRLAIIDAETLRSLIAEDQALAAALLPRILETIADRLAGTRDQLLDLFHAEGVEPW